ncbi:putative signal transduction histidine kinase [Frankia canadensis]|uniref:Putative signal transduction histidine kinase n=1 Tax=Frankia canadensis TaxID=1836972 RepID=A0A2I2KS20_9ACTN|nr:DUF5931 domain-containing protein [Frankia canadensis]SNQ48464.1 putative signal transduction histidine kinase [Frankia canadensis]SOU55754.1 putative signal transduction histidine kinase [Frankia canadensis]
MPQGPGPGRPRGPDGVRGAMWRSLAVFRLVAVVYAVGTVGRDLGRAPHPGGGLAWFGVLAVWSAVMTGLAPALDALERPQPRTRSRPWPRPRDGLVAADVLVCAGITLTTHAAVSPAGSGDVLPALWSASGVFSAALAGGTVGGAAGGVVLAVASFVASGSVSDGSVRPAVLYVVSGIVVGYLSAAAIRAEAALSQVLSVRAGEAERERLARDVHDGVLQVLSLISREAPRGMAAAEVARLAAEQEAALRDLLRTSRPPAVTCPSHLNGSGTRRGQPGRASRSSHDSDHADVDLGALLMALAHASHPPRVTAGRAASGAGPATSGGAPEDTPEVVTVSTPGVPVHLRADHAVEIVAAVRAALRNVVLHAGPGASAWLLVEDDGDAVIVTVRDDGVGIEPGRVEQAARQGRIGLAVSICGRIRDLGGEVVVTGRPGRGTEVELRVPR